MSRNCLFMAAASPSESLKNTQKDRGDSSSPDEMTVLQKHVAFFDRNHDGVVYPWETFQGFRAVGCGVLLSFAGGILVNMALSQKTRPGKFPSPLFPVVVKNAHGAKHGSDSGTFNTHGRFDPAKFEAIFTKNATTQPNALTSKELSGMLKANRESKNYNGWIMSYTEWKLLFELGKDKDGLLQKETLMAFYDGSLFEKLEKERLSSKKKP